MRTGYFANTKASTKVHIVDYPNKPICGSIIINKSFQWCANGIRLEYVECEKCKKKASIFLKGS